jgi:predicted RNA-binding Zn ribbon-like protein
LQPVICILMETPDHVRRLRVVGGDLALDFLNTQTGPPEGPPDDDALRDYADVVAWGRHAGFLRETEADRLLRRARANAGDARDAHKRALRLRRRLSALFNAVAAGSPPPKRSVAALRSAAADALAHAALVSSANGFAWTWAEDDLARPLWPIAHAAQALVTSGPLNRLKRCAGCSFLFIDESKNGSRRWCSMEDCGTTEKSRRYVARRAAGRESLSR